MISNTKFAALTLSADLALTLQGEALAAGGGQVTAYEGASASQGGLSAPQPSGVTATTGLTAGGSGIAASLGGISAFSPNSLTKSDGSFWTWGLTRTQSVPTQIPALKGARQLDDRMAVKPDGTVWYLETDYRTSQLKVQPVSGITNAVDFLYMGEEAGLDAAGQVYIASHKEVGQGESAYTTIDYTRFNQVAGISGVKAMDQYYESSGRGGRQVCLLLKQDGTLWRSADNLASFQQVPGLSGITALASNTALKNDGTVWELPDQYDSDTFPVLPGAAQQIQGLAGIRSIKFEHNAYMAIDSQSRLWFWGSTTTGLSDSAVQHEHKKPVLLTGVTDVKDTYTAEHTMYALTGSGRLYAASLYTESVPSNAEFAWVSDGISAVRNGPRHLILQKTDGSLWGMGINKNGDLGNGDYEFIERSPVPMQRPISVSLNGEEIAMNTGVITKEGQNFVPLRSVFEKLGAAITYEERSANKMITISRKAEGTPGIDIGVSAKTGTVFVNGTAAALPNHPFNLNGTMYLPLRFISEKLGATVIWQPDMQAIEITMK